jgi:outer membrane protein assembly factor BamD
MLVDVRNRRRAAGAFLGLGVFVTALAGCGTRAPANPAAAGQADRFLMDRGNELLGKRNWLQAREYFRQVVDNYPNSALRPDAKLGIGETYLGEGSAEAMVNAANEFREFLTFYPTNPKADLAQYRLASTYAKQMRSPERDQTYTRDALKEYQAFFERYPTSPLVPEVRAKWREARDRLSEASFKVGVHYFRQKWYPGAVDRFREVLRDDPEYSKRDSVYFYLAESLARTDKRAEAVPYFERLLSEFQQSEHAPEARRRLDVIKVH